MWTPHPTGAKPRSVTSLERERAPRAAVELKVSGRRERLAPPAATRDISSSGMFIKTRAPLEVGKRFVVNVDLPGYEVPLEVSAEVVRIVVSGEAGMGVRFIYSGEAQQALVHSQVGRLLEGTSA